MLRLLIIILFFLFFVPQMLLAVEKNNKYGIHLAQPHLEDLVAAAELVNSQGGDWGYITLVIQENDRDRAKWQDIFERLRELRLIPIIRLATKPEGQNWRRAKREDAEGWAAFLDSLNWVVRRRYVVLFNEPNHATEWGGAVDAEDYAQVAGEFAKKLKEKNPDFIIMLAGMDASAPHLSPQYEDEELFLQNIPKAVFDYVDAWASHSYPNPGFSGSPWAAGRGTVRTYEWELGLLGSLGINKKLPVFITETGWRRGNEQWAAANYRGAFEGVWQQDERIIAVTPFVLDYQADPFLGFSWKKQGSGEFYQQYYAVQSLTKRAGEPEQIDRGVLFFDMPKELVAFSSYTFKATARNSGQAIWDEKYGYRLTVAGGKKQLFEYFFSDIKNIKPFQEASVNLYLKTDGAVGRDTLKIALMRRDDTVLEMKEEVFEIVPLPSLKFKTYLFPKLKTSGDDFEIQIFDGQESLVFKRKNLSVRDGDGEVKDIQNIVLGAKYRIVILKPYYFPRQQFVVFKRNNNRVIFEKMIPFDFNRDGRGDWLDLTTLLKNPQLLKLLLP